MMVGRMTLTLKIFSSLATFMRGKICCKYSKAIIGHFHDLHAITKYLVDKTFDTLYVILPKLDPRDRIC